MNNLITKTWKPLLSLLFGVAVDAVLGCALYGRALLSGTVSDVSL